MYGDGQTEISGKITDDVNVDVCGCEKPKEGYWEVALVRFVEE